VSSIGVHIRLNLDLISQNCIKAVVWFKVEQIFDPGARSTQQLGLAFFECGSLIKIIELNSNSVFLE